MYARQMDGFGQEQPQPSPAESPAFHSETVAVSIRETSNNLPYDVVVERLHIEEPEPHQPL